MSLRGVWQGLVYGAVLGCLVAQGGPPEEVKKVAEAGIESAQEMALLDPGVARLIETLKKDLVVFGDPAARRAATESWLVRDPNFIAGKRWVIEQAITDSQAQIRAEIGDRGFQHLIGLLNALQVENGDPAPWATILKRLETSLPKPDARRDTIFAFRIFVDLLVAELSKTDTSAVQGNEIVALAHLSSAYRFDVGLLLETIGERLKHAEKPEDLLQPVLEVVALTAYYPQIKVETLKSAFRETIQICGHRFGLSEVETLALSSTLVLRNISSKNTIYTGKAMLTALRFVLEEARQYPTEGTLRMLESAYYVTQEKGVIEATDQRTVSLAALLLVQTVFQMGDANSSLKAIIEENEDWRSLAQRHALLVGCAESVAASVTKLASGNS